MAISDKIYNKLPVAFQNIAISIFGYFWHKRRFGGGFEEELIEFKKREIFTTLDWEQYQIKELRKILINAFQNVPFYKAKYSAMGFKLSDFENFELEDIKKLPFLEKDELREFGKSTLLSNKLDKKGDFYSSSGSTGTPTSIYFSKNMHQRWSAVFEARIRNWAGLDISYSRGMIGGRLVVPITQKKPPYYRVNKAEKQIYFSINHLSKNTVWNYIEIIKKKKLDYITGYANSVWLIAKYALESNIEKVKLKAVITSSEKITQSMRNDISDFFGCNVYDSYSGIEACGLISQCEYGGMHWSPDVGVIETIDIPATDGTFKELICTGLLNFDQPLIRYRIGDLLSINESDSCECGRQMMLINEIVGRTDDIVTLPDGRQLGSFNRFFADISGIKKVQVVQVELDYFELNIVPSEDFDSDVESNIKKVFSDRLGEVKISIKIVEDILVQKNGKYKAVISHIKN